MTKDNMPRGGWVAFGAVPAVLCRAAWHLVPRWALLWVFPLFFPTMRRNIERYETIFN